MATKKTSKAVTKKQDKEVPDFLQGAQTGYEGVDSESLSIPFLKIAQPTTPQASEDDPSHIDGLKPGMFFNSVSGTVYGNELRVIFLGYYRCYTEWSGDQSNGQYAGQWTPEEVKAANLEQDGMELKTENGNRLVDTRNFFLMLPDHLEEGILLLSMQSTGITHAKRILSRAMAARLPDGNQAPLFGKVWTLKTALNQNDFGRWYQIGQKSTTNMIDSGFSWEVSEGVTEALKSSIGDAKQLQEQRARIEFSDAASPVDDDEEL
jgi:hypothetical protein